MLEEIFPVCGREKDEVLERLGGWKMLSSFKSPRKSSPAITPSALVKSTRSAMADD